MSYAMLLLERFHYMEKVPSTHLLYMKMQNLSEEWLSSAALVFERNVKIGAVVGAKHKFVKWWWTERLSWQKGRKMVWEGRRWHLNGNEFGRSEMLYKKSNEIGGEQLTVCRLSRKHSLGEAEMLFICCMYCRSLFLQGNNSHGHYCEGTKTWAWSESLGRCWCSSENKVNELHGQASRGWQDFAGKQIIERLKRRASCIQKSCAWVDLVRLLSNIQSCLDWISRHCGRCLIYGKKATAWKSRPQVVIGSIAQVTAWSCFWWAPGEN